MVKLLGFRITPFFLFILGLECLALLLSVYLGVLLYEGVPVSVSFDSIDHTIYTSVFLVILIGILTPGFFSQTKVINNIKKSVHELLPGLLVSIAVMSFIVLTNHTSLDSKMLFLAAILSACIGLIINKLNMLGKYWRFLVRTGVN